MWWTFATKKNDPLAQEVDKYENAEDFVQALESQGKVQYHGSPNDFEKFSYEYLGTQGTGEGKGFYFTNNRNVAEGYRQGEGGKLFEAYIDVRKPLSSTKKTITASQLARFIRVLDPDGSEYLSNIGDVSWQGYESVLREAVQMLIQNNDNDVDIICDITNALGGNPEGIYPILKATLGYDGIIVPGTWGDQTITVAFSNDQIITREQLIEYYNKLRQQRHK